MKYYIRERKFDDPTAKTAWSKARDDAEQICEDMGYKGILVCPDLGDRTNANVVKKVLANFSMGRIWRQAFSELKAGDTLLIQAPVIYNCFYLGSILKGMKKKGVRIVALVHDLELLRLSLTDDNSRLTQFRIKIEETGVLDACDTIIVHNKKMMKFLAQRGGKREKMISLRIFDYLMESDTEKAIEEKSVRVAEDTKTLIVAGNLSPEKAGYVYKMPENIHVNLYGVFYQENDKKNLHYQGSFLPGELPAKMQGGFGLVWDGTSPDTCTGVYGEYLRYNNPHKTSLYLASGIPVVIWSKAAMADFVLKEKAGITADSIQEAADKIIAMNQEEYEMYRQNAYRVGKAIRNGNYLRRALIKGGYADVRSEE